LILKKFDFKGRLRAAFVLLWDIGANPGALKGDWSAVAPLRRP
jgi:hypothetical protein